MTDSGTVDGHIDPYEHTNDIRVNLWLSCDVPFALLYFTKPGMHRYTPESSHAHYTVIPVTVLFFFLVVVFRHPHDEVTCVWPYDDGCH